MSKMVYILILLLTISYCIDAQKILMEDTVEDTIVVPEKGPNSKKFSHFYYSIGNFIPVNTGGFNTQIFGSVCNEIGWRYKRKINEILSFGYSFSVSMKDYSLKQDSAKIFPTTTLFDKEKIRIDALNLELYQRFNTGKRGDYMGYFVDIGISGGWNYFSKHISKEVSLNTDQGKKLKNIYIRPPYISDFNLNLIFRLGINNLVLWGSLPVSRFIDLEHYPDNINGFWLGLQIGLHK